mmetsp:Transcript_5748/g.8867  ORF Transcript_5748/g.8867 Transcript_5748/m.8867 type:complete len:229 (+) Transcript_5748:174-860(+)|eukprot:CAMPEP_0184644646 /NCGR_PEP_ID=MMETSP0308-20130426/1341_1 /TAXON_ID=38269 /ORGANISM="Gloeochaete witrockiana, Strain SAG 46.84" /LENGTH=228 /DNA_ID=CAMNT_0027073301 /DNA_START=169 /DNA_END=855 /DNA_ORIENTATION=+
MSFFGKGGSRTFKPKKNIQQTTKGSILKKRIDATLGSGNLREAVNLPPGEDLNEWLAVNTVDFFNQINLLYTTITEFCTPEECPVMSAGPKYEYLWADGVTIKKALKCSAPEYVDYLLTWVENQLEDESIFPSRLGVPFSKNFLPTVKTIFKRLFRIYAHMYHHHFKRIISLGEEAHLNTCFKHFTYFIKEFDLVDKKELAPLADLIDLLEKKDQGQLKGDPSQVFSS